MRATVRQGGGVTHAFSARYTRPIRTAATTGANIVAASIGVYLRNGEEHHCRKRKLERSTPNCVHRRDETGEDTLLPFGAMTGGQGSITARTTRPADCSVARKPDTYGL